MKHILFDLGKVGRVISMRLILIILVIIASGYLVSQFPEESLLIIGVSAVIVIGLWLFQTLRE